MISRRGLLAAGTAGLLAGCVDDDGPAATVGDAGQEWHGTYLDEPGQPLPDITLTDHHGQDYRLADDPSTPVVMLFFGYTNCPDVCPGIVADMATARRRLSEPDPGEVSLILVTTDPARDTPEALSQYLERVDPDFTGLTGDLDVIVPAAASLGIDITEGKQLPSGGYEVDHGTYVLGFGPDRRMRIVWNDATPAEMREDLERLIHGT
ncbi:MAG: SCO family protein [Arachnia sp.]